MTRALIVSVFLFCAGVSIPQERRHYEALAKLGAVFHADDTTGKCTRIDIASALLMDEDLRIIAQFNDVEMLSIENSRVTDKGLEHIGRLSSLRWLILKKNSKLTGTGFARLIRNGPKFQSLVLSDCPITDEGLTAISKIDSLVSISLAGTKITDNGLGLLSNAKTLEHLVLARTAISNGGIKKICELSKLKSLLLHETAIDDDAFSDIVRLRNLSWLDVSNTNVTDRAIPNMIQMKKLTVLRLNNTKVTPNGHRRLKEHLPNAVVEYQSTP